MTVSFLDLQAGYQAIQAELESTMLRSLRSGSYIGGETVEQFEESFAGFVEARHCVGVANGLDALRLSLLALEVGPGDEVIVPSHTFIATWLAVSHCGATPIPVEPDSRYYTLAPERIEAAISPRTKAIIPVHLYGQPADLDAILAIARKHGLHVVEDAAQAHGARYRGRRIGAHGDAVAWSFYPGKNLGALGDGGAITTNSDAMADRLHVLRNYGSHVKYVHAMRGYNSRLDPVQAAALGIKLRHLDRWNTRRATIAACYAQQLREVALILPEVPHWAEPVWHLYVVQHGDRNALQTALESRGVGTLIHYPIPPHLQRAYDDAGYVQGQYPLAESLANRVLSLPMGPQLTDAEVAEVIAAVKAVV